MPRCCPWARWKASADDEVVMLEVVKDKSGENYVTIDNPILLDEVFNEFLDLYSMRRSKTTRKKRTANPRSKSRFLLSRNV